MTSKPASESARATTLAPRSWPSRPGFPTRIRTLRLSAMVSSELLARDDDALDLARSLVDARDARVAHQALDGHLAGVAVAAVDLKRRVANLARALRRVELGDRRLAREGAALLLEPGGAQDEEPRRVELCLHVGEHDLDRLVLGERDVELDALPGVGPGRFERRGRDAAGLRPDADASAVERGHRDLEAVALVA